MGMPKSIVTGPSGDFQDTPMPLDSRTESLST
jgi:hypothetical protein